MCTLFCTCDTATRFVSTSAYSALLRSISAVRDHVRRAPHVIARSSMHDFFYFFATEDGFRSSEARRSQVQLDYNLFLVPQRALLCLQHDEFYVLCGQMGPLTCSTGIFDKKYRTLVHGQDCVAWIFAISTASFTCFVAYFPAYCPLNVCSSSCYSRCRAS